MPISLDPSLPSSLYPLAWLVGTWEGSGALHQRGEDSPDLRVEQRLECTATERGTLAWISEVHTVDAAAPLPPTSAFARADAPAPRSSGTGERRLLMRERGEWAVGAPLPGQDLEAARATAPGSPAGAVSYALSARFDASRGDGSAPASSWAGEVRGPRVQLARCDESTSLVLETRMAGYISGRLMWLWERRPEGTDRDPAAADMIPYLSLELDRV